MPEIEREREEVIDGLRRFVECRVCHSTSRSTAHVASARSARYGLYMGIIVYWCAVGYIQKSVPLSFLPFYLSALCLANTGTQRSRFSYVTRLLPDTAVRPMTI